MTTATEGRAESFDTRLHGCEVCLAFVRTTQYAHAGGRAGRVAVIVEDEASEITVWHYDTRETVSIDRLSSLDAAEVRHLIDEWMDTHNPEPPRDREEE